MTLQQFLQNPLYLSISVAVALILLTLFMTQSKNNKSKKQSIFYNFIPGTALIVIGVLIPKFVNLSTAIQCEWWNLVCHSTQLVKGLFVGLIVNLLMILLLIFGVIFIIKGARSSLK